MPAGPVKTLTLLVERKEARLWGQVEHPFHVIKNLFGHKKVSYRGLCENGVRPSAQFVLANVVLAKRELLDEGHRSIGAYRVRKRPRTVLNCVINRVRQ